MISVYAQEPTPTIDWNIFTPQPTECGLGYIGCDNLCTPWHEICAPTQTWEPLFKTPTPGPTMDIGACPSGLPGDWGTETPSPLWFSQCFNCFLTLTPWATTTPAYPSQTPGVGTGTVTPLPSQTTTPTASATPGAAPTITPTPNFRYYLGASIGSFTVQKQAQSWYGWQLVDFNVPDDYFGGFVADVTINGNVDAQLANCNGMGCNYQGAWQSLADLDRQGGAKVCVTSGDGGFSYTQMCSNLLPGISHVPINHISWINGNRNLTGIFQAYGHPDYSGSITVSNVQLILWGNDWQRITPTPTPVTPTPELNGSYCSNVNGVPGSLPGGNELPDLPVIVVGQASCVVLEPFSLNTSILNWIEGFEINSLDFPGLRICVSPIRFGTLDIVGVSINLDLMAMVMAGVMIVVALARS